MAANFHESHKFLITVAHGFGFFPVSADLKFTWVSAQLVVSVFLCVVGWLDALANVRFMIIKGFSPDYLNGFLFDFTNACFFSFFIILARDWPKLMTQFAQVEALLGNYHWPKTYNLKVNIISGVFLLLEFVEHFSVQCNKVIVAFECKNSTSQSVEYLFKQMSFHQIFDLVEYSPVVGLILQIVNTCFACCWTFVDLFLILLSYYLATRFQQIKKRVKILCRNKQFGLCWTTVDEHYSRVAQLCRLTNRKLSNFILLSFFTNVYFIIFHCFRALTKKRTSLEAAYFVISFGLLILRAVCVCWFGGKVFEESEAPLQFLISLPTSNDSKDIDKFIDKIRYESVGFTGRRLFRVNKSLILKIMTSVLTYELVFVQILGMTAKEESLYSRCE